MMKNLAELCEGILDVTADNFKVTLYDVGYRVVGIEPYGGEIVGRAITQTGSDFWNHIIQKEMGKYKELKYLDNDFIRMISYNGRRFSVIGSDDVHTQVYDWEPICTIIYEILFCDDWKQTLKDHIPSNVQLKVNNYGNTILIHIKKGKWFIKIDIAKK